MVGGIPLFIVFDRMLLQVSMSWGHKKCDEENAGGWDKLKC